LSDANILSESGVFCLQLRLTSRSRSLGFGELKGADLIFCWNDWNLIIAAGRIMTGTMDAVKRKRCDKE